jgi:hypothetical protein
MGDPFKPKTMKRKNLKGLALSAPPPKPAPSAGDAQIPGGIANDDKQDTLEIGVEFQLDLKAEDLIVLRELGSGNGGTVSKVQHAATKVVMARKVRWTHKWDELDRARTDRCRSYTWKRRTKYGNVLCASSASCMTATRNTSSTFTAPSRTRVET